MSQSIFKQEALMAQRILRKEYKLPAYNATPLSIPFQGSNFQLLAASGHSDTATVRVQFDELDPIDMRPGETITGFLFREVKLSVYEDGPTLCTVFLSKENEGRTPTLQIDEEVKTKNKKTIQRVTHQFIYPTNWNMVYGPKGTQNLGDTVLDITDVLPGEEFVSCQFYFDFCTLLDDILNLQLVSSVNVFASGSTYSENFDLPAAIGAVLTDLDAYLTNDYSELNGGSMIGNRVRKCGLIFHFGQTEETDLPMELKGVLVPFPDSLKLNSDYLCKCEGGSFKIEKLSLVKCFLPSVLDALFYTRDGGTFGLADTRKRLGVKITKVLTVLK